MEELKRISGGGETVSCSGGSADDCDWRNIEESQL